MAVKYLSEEWAKECTTRFQASEDVLNAAKGQNVTIQQIVTDLPDGSEVAYYFRLTDGVPEVVLGTADSAEATITQNYATAVILDKEEISPQAAFMQGKLRVKGNLMKLMQLQGLIQTLPGTVADLEREY
ncbi:MAG: SCP2 sterol-binding domain-containing protein [Actinomycetota bacterium]